MGCGCNKGKPKQTPPQPRMPPKPPKPPKK